jgi:hypothetical protein
MALDESDEEVVRMQSNGALMAFLDDCARRTIERPRKSLEEIRRGIKTAPTEDLNDSDE